MSVVNLKIEYRKTAELIPYARNARTHSEQQISQIAASIKEFGFNNPVAIDAGGDPVWSWACNGSSKIKA